MAITFTIGTNLTGLGAAQSGGVRFLRKPGPAPQDRLKGILREVQKEHGDLIPVFGQLLVREWKLRLSGPRGQRTLGVVTGYLRGSVRAKVAKKSSGVPLAKVGTPAKYALIHEVGGPIVRGGRAVGQMPERPHARPALAAAEPKMLKLFDKRLEDAMVRGNRG
jgi:phage gpG-like protein